MARTIRIDVRLAPTHLQVVDALARLTLAARERGAEVTFVGASDELRALIHVAGLAEALRLEPRR